jgi:hypothetical protein
MPDGARFGGSRMVGDSKLISWSGEVVATGPVFADIRWHYRYAGGQEFTLRGRIGERDSAIYWDMACKGSVHENGWELIVHDGQSFLSHVFQIEHFTQRKAPDGEIKVGDLFFAPVSAEPPGLLTAVTPWADWTSDRTQTVVFLKSADGTPPFFIASRDSGAWMEPQETDVSFTGGTEIWGIRQKSIPVTKRENNEVAVFAGVIDSPGGGLRRWMTGLMPAESWRAAAVAFQSKQIESVQRAHQLMVDKRRLDWVKDFTLAWEEDRSIRRPMLFVSQEDVLRGRRRTEFPGALAAESKRVRGTPAGDIPGNADGIALASWLLLGTPQAASDFKIVDRVRHRLALLGDFDLMRSSPLVAALYDALLDSGLIPAAERDLWRARMAYLAYRMEDPATWSVERGYNTGLPNMNVSYVLGQGIVACALSDHPRAEQWCRPALRRMDHWLEHDVGPAGEWMEGASYDHVTASTMMAFVIAARNAGFKDYSKNEKFRLLMRYIAKQYTPPDPTRGNLRVTPPLGRANAGVRMGLFGVLGRFMRDTDPAYAAEMQWMWQQSGRLYGLADNRLCGLECLYIDPELPARQPRWQTELFPRSTAVFRSRFGREDEDYGLVLVNPEIHFARPSEVGSLLDWFAFGKPVAGAFTGGYDERHEMLMTRVLPASAPSPQEWQATTFHKTTGGLVTFSTQPQLDYLRCNFTIDKPRNDNRPMPTGMPAFPPVERRGSPPIAWRRQIAFVKGVGPDEPAYFVFRDTVESDQPTLWQFWALSNGITEAARRTIAAPRDTLQATLPAKPLTGSRFTALGQHGVDLDFFVVAPQDPQARTLRWGTSYKNPPDSGYTEFQDLLQLRLNGAGSYFVVVIPRRRGDPSPDVAAEAAGRAVRIVHSFGTDLVVLTESAETKLGSDSFETTTALVQDRSGKKTVTLGAAGRATIDGRVFTAKPLPEDTSDTE